MNDRIDRYLNEVCWAMGATLAESQTVRDELRAHIADAARELEMSGRQPDAALDEALAALGDAESVGRAMRGSRGTSTLRRPLVQPVGALTFGSRRAYAMPRPALLLALVAAGSMALVASLVYAWPG